MKGGSSICGSLQARKSTAYLGNEYSLVNWISQVLDTLLLYASFYCRLLSSFDLFYRPFLFMGDVGKDFMALKCSSGTNRSQVHLHPDGGYKLPICQCISEFLKATQDIELALTLGKMICSQAHAPSSSLFRSTTLLLIGLCY